MPHSRFARISIIITALWLGIFALLPNALLFAVTFLTRDEAANITGANLSVDGGWTAA